MAGSRIGAIRPPVRLASGHTRTNSQTSDRNVTLSYQVLDPLLSNLSPESTLDALQSTDAVPKNEKVANDILAKSISQVSPAERALCIRAAVAAKNLGLWYKEVQAWEWPKGTDVQQGKGFIPPSATGGSNNASSHSSESESEAVYYGSIPAHVVQRYERRIEEIRDGIDSLGVEELKEHVLNAHIPSRSRPSSSTSTLSVPPPLSYVQLSDFTTVITATILRALPLLSRLNRLLSTWDVRLLVLRQIPGLLRSLNSARTALDRSISSLRSPELATEKDDLYSRATFRAKHAQLESLVVSAGRRMDIILDSLEGREDALPESWIDDLESMEADFSTWVVQAERRTVENEWRRLKVATTEERPQPSTEVALPQEPESVPQVAVNKPTIARQAGRSLMETIDEEDASEVSEVPSDVTESTSADSVEPCNAQVERTAGPPASREHGLAAPKANDVPAPTIEREERSSTDCVERKNVPINEEKAASVTETESSFETPSRLENQPSKPDHVSVSREKGAVSLDLQSKPASTVSSSNDKSESDESQDEESEQDEQALPPVFPPVLPPSVHTDKDIEDKDITPEVDPFSSSVPSEPVPAASVDTTLQGISGDEMQQALEATTSVSSVETPSKDEREAPELNVRSDPLIIDTDLQALPITNRQSKDDTTEPVSTASIYGENWSIISNVESAATASVEKLGPIANHSLLPDVSVTADVGITAKTASEAAASAIIAAKEQSPIAPSAIPTEHFSSPAIQRATSKPSQPPVMSGHDTKPAAKSESKDSDQSSLPKQQLESPIKLSKSRPGHLDLQRDSKKSHRRQVSDGSADSILSDYPSLVSSPEVREPRTASSNGTPLLLETPPQFQTDYPPSGLTPPNDDHTLREERLLRLENDKTPPSATLKHHRTVSLPLQRFINETEDFQFDGENGFDIDSTTPPRRASAASVEIRATTKHPAVTLIHDIADSASKDEDASRRTHQQSDLQRDESPARGAHAKAEPVMSHDRNSIAYSRKGEHDVSRPGSPCAPKPCLVTKRLTAHPSLEGLGLWSSHPHFTGETYTESEVARPPSQPSVPVRMSRQPKDQLDRRISSILNTLPGHIQLVTSSAREPDESSVTSSVPAQKKGRFRSESPQSTPTRSNTPPPSFTITPAVSRRRYSHAHTPEDGSVKLYHLHRSGKTVPTKLFIRSVGENGERVMVRVGGGWADLGEYLREFAIHHGRRKIAQTPRVEVQGLSSHGSPAYSSPGSTLTPNMNTGPSRPRSVLGYRPASSLAVRKVRRASNVSDVSDFRDSSHDEHATNLSTSPKSNFSARRRLSVCSNHSISAASFISESHGAPSVPLGLAGPLPRSRHVSMSPESEAWVEDVLGQARLNKTSKAPKYGAIGGGGVASSKERDATAPSRILPKARSVSDMGTVGLSKRVALRGLNNTRRN